MENYLYEMSHEQYYLLLVAGLARVKWRAADFTDLIYVETTSNQRGHTREPPSWQNYHIRKFLLS